MSLTSKKVLSPDALETLSDLGEPARLLLNGWRSISVSSYSSTDTVATIALPEDIDSIAGLEFRGFTAEAAASTREQYKKAREEYAPFDIIKYATGYIRAARDSRNDDREEWKEAMRDMGMDEKTCDRIVTPGFDDIRLCQTAKYWVLETVKDRYAFLNALDFLITHQIMGGIAQSAVSPEAN